MTHRPQLAVRSMREDDDLDEINLGNELWMGAVKQRELLAATPADIPAHMLVAELDGRPVGSALIVAAGVRALGYALGQVYVRSDARRHGVGRALFDAVNLLARKEGLPGVMYGAPDSDPDGAAVAAHWGLVEHGHHIESSIDLATLDPEEATRAAARAAAAGFEIQALPDGAAEDEWLETYDFFVLRMREAPDSEESTQDMPYSVFRALIVEPWQAVVARRDGALAGITTLMPRANEGRRLNTMFTGVHPDARGNGLSAALKLEHARQVRAQGWQAIVTQNMDQNAPILAVNDKMGFRPSGGAKDFGIAF